MGGRYVEIGGSEEVPPAVDGTREWLLIVVPAVTIGVLAGFIAGVDVRLLTGGALVFAAVWRLLDGLQPDLWRFLTYLRVVAVADSLFWLPALLFTFFTSTLPTVVRIDRSILLFWLYPLLLLAGMVGVWLFMSLALDDRGRPARAYPFVVLAGLLGLTAVHPAYACAAAAVYAVLGFARAVRVGHSRQGAGVLERRTR